MFCNFRIWLASAALLASAGIVSAQMKVGVVSMNKAMGDTAEVKKASAALQTRLKPKADQLEGLRKELEGIQQKLQQGANTLSQQQQAELNAQGQRKQREYQRLSEDLQAEADAESNPVVQRVAQRLQGVVKKLAEEKGLDFVIDVGNTIYAKPALDLTTEATAAYDKAYPAQ